MNSKRILFTVLKLVCILILLAAMVLGYLSWQKTKGEQRQNQETFSSELRPLTLRQRELELQLESLDKEYTRIVVGMSTTQVLAVDPGDWVELKLRPAMENAGMVGAVAMSLDKLPGEDGALSPMQVQKLENDGWQLIYDFDESDFGAREKDIKDEIDKYVKKQKRGYNRDVPEKERLEMEQTLLTEALIQWKQEVDAALGELGIELDQVIYFEKGAYKRLYDSALRAAGFDMIVHHGEEDRIVYADLTENKVWFPGAISWCASDRAEQLEEVVDLGANLVLTVSQPGDNEQDQFVSESFSSMLRELDEYRMEGTMEVCTFRDMANFQTKSVVDKNAKDNERQKKAVQEELDEVNEQIQAVYAKYGME